MDLTTDLTTYLNRKHRPKTVKIYLFEINHFINHVGVGNAEKVSYTEVIDYMAYLRKRYDNPATINRILAALKIYFDYLVAQHKRMDNPCRSINLRDKGNNQCVQIQDLLNESEIASLFKRIERFPTYALKNQVMMLSLIHI